MAHEALVGLNLDIYVQIAPTLVYGDVALTAYAHTHAVVDAFGDVYLDVLALLFVTATVAFAALVANGLAATAAIRTLLRKAHKSSLLHYTPSALAVRANVRFAVFRARAFAGFARFFYRKFYLFFRTENRFVKFYL